MAITDFEFPGVELNQEWVVTPPLVEPQLGVAIIGEADGTTTAPDLALGVITNVGDIEAKLGQLIKTETTTVDEQTVTVKTVNKMAMACYLAFTAASGTPIYYVKIKDTAATGADFVTAMKFLEKFSYIYSIVPVTNNATKLAACITQAAAESNGPESKIRRTVWCGVSGVTEAAITSAKNAIAPEGGTNSYRAQVVWSPGATYDGEPIPAECLAAAPAGMRSYEPAHRPISNLAYEGFQVIDNTSLTEEDFKDIASRGVWIITNNFNGVPINKRQVTAYASTDINRNEESNVANIDSIAMVLCRIGEDLVGCSNITPALLKALSDTITGTMDRYLINITGNVYVGPQLLSWSLDALYQDDRQLDHIYAVITVEPPKPFNRFVITLRVV